MKQVPVLISFLTVCLFSCQAPQSSSFLWEESWKEQREEPEPEPEPEPVGEGKPRFVWIDAAANFEDYGNNQDKIREDCVRIFQTGFTDIIVDVRPTTGDVLFQSSVAPALHRIDRWYNGSYGWAVRTADFDYLQAFIEAGHDAGLRVHAAINTFVGGYHCPYGLGDEGMVYSDPSKRAWCTVQNLSSGLTHCMDVEDYGPRFLNPAHPEVQSFLLTLLTELASYEDLDGIVLDRCRYDDSGLQSDFSDVSREAFEQMCGQSLSNWPRDIFLPGTQRLGSVVSPLQKQWLSFRVKTIHDFIEKAAETVHAVRSDLRFGVYVGGWYSTYYTSGVNWASPDYNCRQEYSWATDAYQEAGFADHLDYLFLGAYAGVSNIHGDVEWTMEGFCKLGAKRLNGDVPFAGGPDVGNGSGFEFGGRDDLIPDIVTTCIDASDGLFIFDLCHIKMFDYWDAFETGINLYLASLNQ